MHHYLQNFSVLRFYEHPPRGIFSENQIAKCVDKRNKLLLPISEILFNTSTAWWTKIKKATDYLRDLPSSALNLKADAIARGLSLMICAKNPHLTSRFIELETFLFICRWNINAASMEAIIDYLFAQNGGSAIIHDLLQPELLDNIRKAAISTMNNQQRYLLAKNGLETTLPANQIFCYDWIITPWTMAKRKGILLWAGKAYLHRFVALEAMKEIFIKNLKLKLKLTMQPEFKSARDRIHSIYLSLLVQSPYETHVITKTNQLLWTKDGGETAPKPSCIQMIFSRAKITGHIGYKGRMTLILWMKNIGVSQRNAMITLKHLLVNENYKELENSVRGLWKKDYKSYSCFKIQNFPKPVHKLETHGCPKMSTGTNNACRDCTNTLLVKDIEDIIKSPAEWTKRSIF